MVLLLVLLLLLLSHTQHTKVLNCAGQVKTEISSPLSSPPLIYSPMSFPSSPDSAQNQRWLARTKNEKREQRTTDKGLPWVEEEKRTKTEQEMKVKEQEVKIRDQEVKVREEVEKRRRDEIAQRQVMEKAERERRAESEMRENLEGQRRLEAELMVNKERERRRKEETDYRGTEKSEGLKRLVEPKEKEEETPHKDQVNKMKKIEVHSSSSSLSEEDSLPSSWQVSTNSWQAQPQQNSSSSTHLQFSSSPTKVTLNQHSETRVSLESNNTPPVTMTAQNSSAQDVQVRPSVGLEPDSEATSDYSESDVGSPFVLKRAVPVHQQAPSTSGSPVSVKKAIPVQQDSSEEESIGSDSETDMRQAISVAGLSGTVRQAQPVAGLSESDDEVDAAFVRRAIPVVATDTDSVDSLNEPGTSQKIISSGSPQTNSVKLITSSTAAPRPMTRVETLSDSSTMTEDDDHNSPPIRKAVPIITTDSSSNSSGSDSDLRPALPMTRVNRALSIISEVGEIKVIAKEICMLLREPVKNVLADFAR